MYYSDHGGFKISNWENDLVCSQECWGHWGVVSCPDSFSFGFNSWSFQIAFYLEDFFVVFSFWPSSSVSVGGNFSLWNHSQVDSVVSWFWEGVQSPALWHEKLNEEFSFSDLLLCNWSCHFNFDLLVVVSKDISAQNVEGFISSIVVGSLNDCFCNDPRVIVSDLSLAYGLFNGVWWAVVVEDEEWTE